MSGRNSALVSADFDFDSEETSAQPFWFSNADVMVSAAGDRDVLDFAAREPANVTAIVYPLNRLGHHTLRRTIVVSVERDDSDIIMSNSRLRIWGVGRSLYDALDDFATTYIEVLRSYERTPPSEMTDAALAYLLELQSYIA
jgi:hypothetical protein